ncbi:hypothetical protein [Tessaracoccus aquimaris]|uniref:hypothetical protein n=1 Tax=Tessaracoccus aquimaris TaxID=1332264 RepID=UPI0011AB33B1|nr:hypothetical protein [Tessaracoccus aquimaris]
MSRALHPTEAAWARHLIGYGASFGASPSVAQRLRWLDYLGSATAGKECGCGTCPSVELVGADGVTPSGPSCYVLEGGTRDLLVLLHVIDDRPAYLEGAPSPGLSIPEFPELGAVAT